MVKSRAKQALGDLRSPPLRATENGLRAASDQAYHIEANLPNPVAKSCALANLTAALKASGTQNGLPTTCRQTLWVSFFFDGTGNNLDADLDLLKHSNVARLFRAHTETNEDEGIGSVYIPGVGTYFPEIGDDGGSPLGLGCGAMGEKRLNFALGRFDSFLARPLGLAQAPENAIDTINVAVFGFSRGAALARAFINLLMESRCKLCGSKWTLKNTPWPIRFRFMGLFDTVASVGRPMSTNTTGYIEAYRADVTGMISKRLKNYENTRPEELAFFKNGGAGADPAPGNYTGHDGWGGKLKIHETVEEVRHFIAAHEIRNSFPLDSVSELSNGHVSKPAHFFETVYPGSHSDIGGSYAPGEGARGLLPEENLGLIPLRHMYDYALRQGVPLLPENLWKRESKNDFKVSTQLIEEYNYYMKALGSFHTLGGALNRNRALYLAWRFKSIKRKLAGDRDEANLIRSYDSQFRQKDAVLEKENKTLAQKEMFASLEVDRLTMLKDAQGRRLDEMGESQKTSTISDADIYVARKKYKNLHDERLKIKARKYAVPNMKDLESMLEVYDKQLFADAQTIRNALRPVSTLPARATKRRSDLRPHYKTLLEAFENEFEMNKGLNDEIIIRFFENYVHDSLAGFAKDATLPSDPRVVYLGGDEKLRYASAKAQDSVMQTETRIA